MRSRLGGIAVALAMVLAGCGSDGGPADASPGEADAPPVLDLVSARDTLPVAPARAGALTVLLAHPAGAGDAGFDAAAGALAQRPDLDLVLAAAIGSDSTMSGFRIDVAGRTATDAVTTALGDPERTIDLVVIGVTSGHGIGELPPEAETAVRAGVPALVVGAERADVVDLAAATMQLLEVLDLELDELLDEPAAVHRLAVPSCSHGMLRGRQATDPGPAPDADLRADCTSTERPAPVEADAFAHGWATLTRLSDRPNN
jgi:hypothetical protein